MTKLDNIIALVGSKAELARIIQRDPGRVTRMLPAGIMPWHFNAVMEAWAAEHGVSADMAANLEPVCACCGRGAIDGIDMGRRVH